MPFYFDATEEQRKELMEHYDTRYSDISFVHCNRIKGVHMYYTCPFCQRVGNRLRYSTKPFQKAIKANGQEYKSAKPVEHYHGSGYNNKNRFETRLSHCCARNYDYECMALAFGNNEKMKDDFKENVDMEICMVVDDNTVRETTDENQVLNLRRNTRNGTGKVHWYNHKPVSP